MMNNVRTNNFEPGDILVTRFGSIMIFKEEIEGEIYDYAYLGGLIQRMSFDSKIVTCDLCHITRYASEKEKQKFFTALKNRGKYWNPSKLCIEDIY